MSSLLKRAQLRNSCGGRYRDARDLYVSGARSRLMCNGLSNKSNDGSWSNVAFQSGAGLRFPRESSVLPSLAQHKHMYCLLGGMFNCKLRHFHKYGRPPFQAGGKKSDWRDRLSKEEVDWYKSRGMADKKGVIWKDAYTVGASIRPAKKMRKNNKS